MRDIRTAHGWLCGLITLAVLAQFILAGAAAFGAISFATHTALGWGVAGAALLALLLATLGRDEILASGILFVAVAIQVALGALGTHLSAWFGALHALTALVVLVSAMNLTHRTTSLSWITESLTRGSRPAKSRRA